jgi:hypothetical protein
MTKNEFYEVVMQSYRPAEKLISMVPADKLNWRPGPTFMSAGQVICHLSGGVGAGLEWLLASKLPSMEEMAEALKLENLPSCSPQEALDKLEKDKTILRQVLDGLSEEEFTNKVVSVPWGVRAKMERMAIGFLTHFTNHKMQLFTYLKLLGLPVDTQTLYGI